MQPSLCSPLITAGASHPLSGDAPSIAAGRQDATGWSLVCRRRSVTRGSGSDDESGDEGLQLFLGRLDFGRSLLDRGRQGGDRGFGFTELVEGLLVQRRSASNRREIVAQPLFVFDELTELLFQLIELGVVPPKRLPSRSKLPSAFLTEASKLVCRNEHTEPIACQVEKPDRLF